MGVLCMGQKGELILDLSYSINSTPLDSLLDGRKELQGVWYNADSLVRTHSPHYLLDRIVRLQYVCHYCSSENKREKFGCKKCNKMAQDVSIDKCAMNYEIDKGI